MSLPLGLRAIAAVQTLQRRLGLGMEVADVATWDLAKRRGGPPAKWMYRRGPTDVDVQDLQVPGRAGAVPVRIYRPRSSGPHPALLYLHGGAWLMGCPDGIDHVCRDIARNADVTVVSVDYRLAPEHPYPAGLEDCADVLAWLRTAASGVDASRIAVAGDSAGGNLAAALCLLDRSTYGSNGPSPLRAQILLYPALDLTLSDPFPLTFRGPGLTLADCRALVDIYLAKQGSSHDELCSPLLADDLSQLPPALIITAGVDILREDGRRYAERLLADGVQARWSDYPRMPHAFVSLNRICRDAPSAVQEICDEIVGRLHADDAAVRPADTDQSEQLR